MQGHGGEQANPVSGVQKPAAEEPSGQRFFEWIVRHSDETYGRRFQPVEDIRFPAVIVKFLALRNYPLFHNEL